MIPKTFRLLLLVLALGPRIALAANGADDLTGLWTGKEGRLSLIHKGDGLHRVLGTWRGQPVDAVLALKRGRGPEAELGGVWRVSKDRTRMTKGRSTLLREVRLGHVRLKLMTYNIKGIWHLPHVDIKKINIPGPFDIPVPDVDGNDMKALSRYIRQEKPDLVALQEVERIALPTVDSQAETVAKETGYDYRYAAASVAGRDLPGPIDVGWGHGNAILVRKRRGLRLTGSREVELPVGRGLETRNALFAGLEVAGVGLRFASAHFTHNDSPSRRAQSAKLVSLATGPTLLLGDLNAVREHSDVEPLAKLCRGAFEEGYAGGVRSTIGDEAGDRRIDHILLCNTSARVLSTWVAGVDGDAIDGFSDHRALVSVIELPVAQALASR